MLEVARQVFGYTELRVGQRGAIEAVLGGRDAIVLLPTGGGKSACYQVPAVVLAQAGRGTTLVISPLIALMNDQVGGLRQRGIAAAAIHSQLDDAERLAAFGQLQRGELAVLYVSPERAVLDGFKRLLARARISLLAIDEAHCVSQWGHEFRPEYMRLAELREIVDAPAIALTATATGRVMTEIGKSLGLRDPLVIRGDFRRPNLAFEVHHHRADAARLDATIAILEAAGLRNRIGNGRGIVYCSTRKKTETVAAELKAVGFAAQHYHAGRTGLARDRAQRAFELGRARILVATSAFGMGIDYPDVRAVVHFQAPGSVEAYYQEAGRAGRDGDPARCVMLFGQGDLMTQRRISGGSSRDADALVALERYALATGCRQRFICAHFTGADDTAACARCDGCTGTSSEPVVIPAAPVLAAPAQQLIVEALGTLARGVGKTNLARALRGSHAKAVVANGLVALPQFGRLTHETEASIVATIDQLVAERRLVRRGKKYPLVALPGAPAARRASPRPSRPRGTGPRISSITLELDSFRKRMARQLKWKAYMVLQRATIAAIDRDRPQSREALAKISGLGPAKIARFGEDILAVVRRHA